MGAFVNVLGSIGFPLLLASILLGATALVVRFRRSRGAQRKQLKWISASAVLVAFSWIAVSFTHEEAGVGAKQISVGLFLTAITTIPISAGFAILRYRLYDIDIIIKRSLMYGSLTAVLAGVFAAVNIVAQKAFVAVTGQRSDTATAVTALVVVALFTPLKSRIQSVVDRRLKEAPDPAKDMRGFAEQVQYVVNVFESEQLINRYLDEAITAFGVENGVLYLDKNGMPEPVCVRGDIEVGSVIRIPLVDRGTEVGYLVLGPRRDGRDFSQADQEALSQAAAAMAAALRLSKRLS